ncbi:MAG: hypothetical protein ABS81_03450 [Pseudonocardia sp. SCN 72-86]|nr:MAG: hypothetical protein ABS81_03450 [Pseudonocardia sp. SCN 72-86]
MVIPSERRAALREALSRSAPRVRVLIIGQPKVGKADLVNALFDVPVLPSAETVPGVTCVITVGERGSGRVRFANGRIAGLTDDGVAELTGLLSPERNPGNRRGVDQIELAAPSSMLPVGAKVVEQAPTGSMPLSTPDDRRDPRPLAMVAVLVVAADRPIPSSDLAQLDAALSFTTHVAAVATLASSTSSRPTALSETTRFTARALQDRFGRRIPVFALTEKCPTTGGGIGRFGSWLSDELSSAAAASRMIASRRVICREMRLLEHALQIEDALRQLGEHARGDALASLDKFLLRAVEQASAARVRLAQKERCLADLIEQSRDAVVATALADSAELLTDSFPGPAHRVPEAAGNQTRHTIVAHAQREAKHWYRQLSRPLHAQADRAIRDELADITDTFAAARHAAGALLHLALPAVSTTSVIDREAAGGFIIADGDADPPFVATPLRRVLPAVWRRKRLLTALEQWRTRSVPGPFDDAAAVVRRDLAAQIAHGTLLLNDTHRDFLGAITDGCRWAVSSPSPVAALHDRAARAATLERLHTLLG